MTELNAESPPVLWDLVVRASHWGVALVVLTNEALTRGGSAAHVWAGWIGLTLLALRLIWGLIGPPEARFAAFPPNPKAAIAHLRDLAAGHPRSHRSHNPAGAVMVYALWGTLALLIASGVAMSGPTPFAPMGDNATVASGDGAAPAVENASAGVEIARKLHDVLANLLRVLVGLHIGGVLLESLVMRRNLVPPMLFGDRTRPHSNKDRSGS